MKETLISFETAKLAKEKGFNISTKSYYGCDNPSGNQVKPNQLFTIELKEEGIIESQKGTMIYSAPRQSLLQKWLREEKDIFVTIDFEPNIETESAVNDTYTFKIIKQNNNLSFDKIKGYGIMYDSYEEALEEGLQEALKLI